MPGRVKLNPMSTAPEDVIPHLVYLEKESLGSRWQIRRKARNFCTIGHLFEFDAPKALGWIPVPTEIELPDEVAECPTA